jgi:L-iditol 2-dehydrogenase
MKRALLKQIGELAVVKTSRPSLPPGGILVAMEAVAICRTDIKMVRRGHKDLAYPRVLGHEGVGVIVESENPLFETGVRVAVYPGSYCGTCCACKGGHTGRCGALHIYGFNKDGFFQTIIPFAEEETKSLVPVPLDIKKEAAVLAEPLACCLGAMDKFEKTNRGTALIIGAGAMGSLFAALLLSEGWDRVIVADRDPRRVAHELPAGVVPLDVSRATVAERLREMKIAGEIDLIVPACSGGLSWPFWDAMTPGGCVSLFSGTDGEKPFIPVDMNSLHYREITLAGSYGCNKKDFDRALGMLAGGGIDVSFLNTSSISLTDIMKGMEMLEKHEMKKVIIDKF